MANTAKKSNKLVALFKKTAQKLVSNPKAINKELKKLALTLPLMALLVEEVRAAQKKVSIDAAAVSGEVFEDETALADFIEAQNLDPAQYAEIEQELEGVVRAKAGPYEDLVDQPAHISHYDSVTAQDYLLADSGTGVQPEVGAAGAEVPFTPASLPVVPPALGGLVGGAAAAVGAAAIINNQNTTAASPADTPVVIPPDTPTEVQAEGSHLTTSLKDLQKLGVDFVAPASGQGSINVELGAGVAFGSTTGIPLFGDTNRDGIISAAENSALSVNLSIANAAQLAEVAALGNLASFGIDSVSIDLANQALLNTLANNSTLAADLAAIRANGLTVNTIDLASNAAILTDAQAAGFINNGLSFSADDTNINLQVEAGTTHLSTSLKDLQKLGVDAVTVAGAATGADLHVTLGDGAAINFANGTLPSFGLTDSALNVTLDVNSVSQLAEVATLAAPANVNLAALGLDNVQLNLASQTELEALFASNIGNNSSFDQSLSAVRAEGLSVTTIDMGSTAAVHLSGVQAAALLQDGLHFAAADGISLQAEAGTTHLSTSLKDLNKLGVDAVVVSGADSVNVDLGGLTLADLGSGGAVTSFDDALNVTLNVANAAEFGTTAGLASQLHAAHIDNVKLDVLDTNTDGDFEDQLIALFGDTSFQTAVSALSTPNVSVGTTLDLGGASVAGELLIHAEQTSGLAQYGIGFAANDQITMDTQMQAGAHSTHLGHSLKDLQIMGVDTVTVVGANAGDDINVDFGAGYSVNLATGGLPQFASNLDVTVHAANGSQLNELGALANTAGVDLGAKGIDHVQLNFETQTAFDSLFGSTPSLMSTLAANSPVSMLEGAVTALTADNVHINPLDFASNVGHLSDSQAQILLEQGLTFAANDSITLQADAGTTHLSTSLKDLQKLGVDAVTATVAGTSPDLHVSLGSANAADFASTVDFADFDAALDVTLDVQGNTDQFGFAANFAAGLHAANIDNVKFDVADAGSDGYLNDLLAFGADQNAINSVAALKTNMVGVELDLGGSAQAGQLFINEAQANQLIAAGVHFSADDHITLNATGTYATAHMADLQKLGVDATHEPIASSVQMASLSSSLQDSGLDSLDVFDTQHSFDASLLSQLDNFDWTAGTNNLIAPVATAASTDAVSSMVSGGVDVLSAISLDPHATWGDLIETLQDAGLATAEVQASAAVHISDDLSAALYESGMLHALPDANIAIDAGANKVLNTSLKAMADLGVDSVNADHKVYVELGLKPEDGQTIADLHDLFAALGADNATATDLFGNNDAGLVLNQTTFDALGTDGVQQLLGDLTKLGFTEVDVMGANAVSAVYEINVTAQTPVLSQVALIGTDATNDLAHVFDPDIFNKPVK